MLQNWARDLLATAHPFALRRRNADMCVRFRQLGVHKTEKLLLL
jgi:hypothetical protein